MTTLLVWQCKYCRVAVALEQSRMAYEHLLNDHMVGFLEDQHYLAHGSVLNELTIRVFADLWR